MTGYSPEQLARMAARHAREAENERRYHVAQEERKKAMRARGEPVRGDFSSRAEYRKAVSRFRRKGGK